MYTQVGSFLPFAKTKAEREKTGDPRLSLEERYGTKDAFLQKVETAGQQLVKSRLLLPADVARVKARAATQWDFVMNKQNTSPF
jgi:hypothetical protein